MSEESKKKWEAEQHDTVMSFVSILKKEHLNKSKTLQIQFWDKFVLFLKSNPNNIATELDALIRVLNCLMSELSQKRKKKLSRLGIPGNVCNHLEVSVRDSFETIEDLMSIRNMFVPANVTRRRRRNRIEEDIPTEQRDDDRVEEEVSQSVTEDIVETGPNESTMENERRSGKFVSNNVINLSGRVLTDNEISVLSKGLKFSPTPKELDRSQLKQDLEAFGRRLRLKWHFRDEESADFSSNAFRVPSKFKPPHEDAAIEIYLSVLEEKLMSISVEGSNFSNLTKGEAEAYRKVRTCLLSSNQPIKDRGWLFGTEKIIFLRQRVN